MNDDRSSDTTRVCWLSKFIVVVSHGNYAWNLLRILLLFNSPWPDAGFQEFQNGNQRANSYFFFNWKYSRCNICTRGIFLFFRLATWLKTCGSLLILHQSLDHQISTFIKKFSRFFLIEILKITFVFFYFKYKVSILIDSFIHWF